MITMPTTTAMPKSKKIVTYEATVKPSSDDIADIQTELKKNPEARVVVAISVGQVNHLNGRFRASLKGLVQVGFKRFDIVVGDTLQRWSRAIDAKVEPEAYRTSCESEGSSWLAGAEEDLKNILGEDNYKIIRWDEMTQVKDKCEEIDFDKMNTAYHKLYAENADFRNAVDQTIDRFLKNRDATPKARAHSVHYVLEEIAAFDLYYQHCQITGKDTSYFAYPGGSIPAFEYAREHCFRGATDEAKLKPKPFAMLDLSIKEKERPLQPSFAALGLGQFAFFTSATPASSSSKNQVPKSQRPLLNRLLEEFDNLKALLMLSIAGRAAISPEEQLLTRAMMLDPAVSPAGQETSEKTTAYLGKSPT